MGVISKVYTLVQQICASVQSGMKEKWHVVAIRLFFSKNDTFHLAIVWKNAIII